VIGAAIKIGETGFRLWSGTAQAALRRQEHDLVRRHESVAGLLGVGYIVG